MSEQLPIHAARTANDFLPAEDYSNPLPEREVKSSLLSRLVHNRKVQVAAGVIIVLGIIAGAAVGSIALGQKQAKTHFANNPIRTNTITVTPPVTTFKGTKTELVTAGTTTFTQWTTLAFNPGVGTYMSTTFFTQFVPMETSKDQEAKAEAPEVTPSTSCTMGGQHHTAGEGPKYTIDGLYRECLDSSRAAQLPTAK